jgi:hypothetical protein
MSLSPGVTMLLATALWTFLRALLFGSAAIALENLALRHQLVVLQRAVARPRLTRCDRILWVWLSRLWASWRSSLVIVQPATVLAWHRKGFQLYWRWKARVASVGRPRLDPELRRLIRRMARENPTWGRRRIRAELALLGDHVAELTVAKYMRRTSPRPSPTWRANTLRPVVLSCGSIIHENRYRNCLKSTHAFTVDEIAAAPRGYDGSQSERIPLLRPGGGPT